MQRFYRELPSFILDILNVSEGWLVGGSISSIMEMKTVNDYDIIIPSELYNKTYCCVREYIVGFNSFGGLKIKFEEISIDIWIEDLNHFLFSANSFNYAYNFKKNILLKNLKD